MNRASEAAVVDFVRHAPWEEMVPVLKVLAERVYEHRKANKGYAPKPVFEYLLGMGGATVSVQIVNEVINEKGEHLGFALKQRESSEAGDAWANLYHSTCCTATLFDTPQSALARDTKETFDPIPENDELEFLGITIHDEPERRSACYTVMYRRKITTQQSEHLQGKWMLCMDQDIREHYSHIVDHNCYLLEWVLDENRPSFADVRGGWWPGKHA